MFFFRAYTCLQHFGFFQNEFRPEQVWRFRTAQAGGACSMLQWAGRGREGDQRFSSCPAESKNFCIRQRFHGWDCRDRARCGRGGIRGKAPRQRFRRTTHVRWHRCRHLRACRWRRHLWCSECQPNGRTPARRAARHGCGRPSGSGAIRLPVRSSYRQ